MGSKPAVVLMNIKRDENRIVLDEEDYDITVDQLRSKLPDDSPRYIAYKPSGAGFGARPTLIQYLPLPASTFVLLLHYFYASKVKDLLPGSKDYILEGKSDLTADWLADKLKK